jgi:hypothetical protein
LRGLFGCWENLLVVGLREEVHDFLWRIWERRGENREGLWRQKFQRDRGFCCWVLGVVVVFLFKLFLFCFI